MSPEIGKVINFIKYDFFLTFIHSKAFNKMTDMIYPDKARLNIWKPVANDFSLFLPFLLEQNVDNRKNVKHSTGFPYISSFFYQFRLPLNKHQAI